MNQIVFESDGYKLGGNLFVPESSPRNGAFLFIQGWTGHQNLDAAEAVTELGYTVLTYDMRGHLSSGGNLSDFSRADFVHDAGVAYDYLRKQVGSDAFIGVIGASFGSYTAAILSAERDVYCLSLRVPANFPDEGYDDPQLAQMTEERKAWRSKPLSYEQNKALTAVHNFKGKIQIVEAGADELVAHQTPQNYADAIDNKSLLAYEIMPNAPHRLADESLRADYRSRLIKWIEAL